MVTSYLGHGFQNRWLSDRFITTKSSSTVGRHRSICSMQITPYQGPWGIYTGNGGELTACIAEKQYESNALAVLFYYSSPLIVTLLTRQLHVVVVRWSVLLESTS